MKGKEKAKIKMSSPWVTLLNEYVAMFGDDPDIKVESRNDGMTIRLLVSNSDKADALTQLLPDHYDFGTVTVGIEVVPDNGFDTARSSLFVRAFANNPVLSRIITLSDVFASPITYVVFRKEVVQFWNDNLGDPHGNVSTLYQDLAGDVLGDQDGILYCTESEED